MSIENLEVYRRTEELFYRVYPSLKNFPKSEKFSLCQNIRNNFSDLLKSISLGNSVKSKRLIYLQEADGYLQTLKILIKLSYRLKYISEGFYKTIDLEFTTINNLLSGYIKSTNNYNK